jgi:hypothetical protein
MIFSFRNSLRPLFYNKKDKKKLLKKIKLFSLPKQIITANNNNNN